MQSVWTSRQPAECGTFSRHERYARMQGRHCLDNVTAVLAAVCSQPFLRLRSGVSPYHRPLDLRASTASTARSSYQLCCSPARPRAVPAEGTQDGKWRVMNSPSLRVVPSAGAEGRGKDRLSVGAFTISRSHAVSRGARVGSTAAEIIATFVCTSTSACARDFVRVRQCDLMTSKPRWLRPCRAALCMSWPTWADQSN